jgi:8-oxo-dGTP pyrophosphatase MutT (NUDIX family)
MINMDYGFRKGIQAIIYREINSKREFLILHRVKNWVGWEFPKGGIKQNETYADAVIRELWEECGIVRKDIIKIWETHNNFLINYPKKMWEQAGYKGALNINFIVEINSNFQITIKQNDEIEHDGFKWVTEEEAFKYLDSNLFRILMLCNKIKK